jgi:hypothetical protein
MVRVAEKLDRGAVALVRELELRREVLKRAGSKNTKALPGNSGLSICVRKLAEIFVGPLVNDTGFRIAAVVEIDATDIASLKRETNAISVASAHLLNCLLV